MIIALDSMSEREGHKITELSLAALIRCNLLIITRYRQFIHRAPRFTVLWELWETIRAYAEVHDDVNEHRDACAAGSRCCTESQFAGSDVFSLALDYGQD